METSKENLHTDMGAERVKILSNTSEKMNYPQLCTLYIVHQQKSAECQNISNCFILDFSPSRVVDVIPQIETNHVKKCVSQSQIWRH